MDADVVVLDEYDLMAEGVFDLAQKRLASSRLGWLRIGSTPRYPEAGVNGLYLASDQRAFFIRCEHCGLRQKLEWEASVDFQEAKVVCRKCRKPIDLWRAEGEWVAARPGNEVHGYHINRLYSPLASIRAMIEASQSESILAREEFMNSDLGLVFVPPGGCLSIGDVDLCRRHYEMSPSWGEPSCMGVDVGMKLFVVVRSREGDTWRVVFIGVLDDFEELDALMVRYSVAACVVDAQPEHRKALEFQKRHRGKVWVAFYDVAQGEHEWAKGHVVHVNRTVAMEEILERFRRGRNTLPSNARQLGGGLKEGMGEYYREVIAPYRMLEQDGQGNFVARYLNKGRADHYFHAEVYCGLASRQLPPPRREPFEPIIYAPSKWNMGAPDFMCSGWKI